MANLAMAVANLLVSCPLDGKVDTFSMCLVYNTIFLCGDSRDRACFSCIKTFLIIQLSRYIVYSGFVAEAKR